MNESKPQRYLALDAMRGFLMLVLVSGGLGMGALIKTPKYHWIAAQFHHLDWEGLIVWELIMPSFMFMVGTSLPFALSRRTGKGATFPDNFRHVAYRTLRLILLGQFLTTYRAGHYQHEPYETLTQLGASYFCCFLVLSLRPRWQVVAASVLMAINWGLYVLFPGSAGPFSPQDNIGAVIDRAVWGLNPGGDWASMNFLGSSVTVLFGAWAGQLFLSKKTHALKQKILLTAAAGCFAAGTILLPVNPIIHKAWTASFTLLHTGCVLLAVTVFYLMFDVKGYRKPAFPLVVVGMNSIFIYMLSQLLRGWFDKVVASLTYRFQFLGEAGPAVQACAVTLAMWYVCYWLYKRGIFFKV